MIRQAHLRNTIESSKRYSYAFFGQQKKRETRSHFDVLRPLNMAGVFDEIFAITCSVIRMPYLLMLCPGLETFGTSTLACGWPLSHQYSWSGTRRSLLKSRSPPAPFLFSFPLEYGPGSYLVRQLLIFLLHNTDR